jgi:hypothetical protein
LLKNIFMIQFGLLFYIGLCVNDEICVHVY